MKKVEDGDSDSEDLKGLPFDQIAFDIRVCGDWLSVIPCSNISNVNQYVFIQVKTMVKTKLLVPPPIWCRVGVSIPPQKWPSRGADGA